MNDFNDLMWEVDCRLCKARKTLRKIRDGDETKHQQINEALDEIQKAINLLPEVRFSARWQS